VRCLVLGAWCPVRSQVLGCSALGASWVARTAWVAGAHVMWLSGPAPSLTTCGRLGYSWQSR